ncbi:MAG: HAMP domain-containing sensor histidine kinase [Prolixibacteraceae bacterium]|jgi:two-component system phosphate regulon sensor histidine kinase PhoR|nr:HAMP domain-containing sensor histidine kinase [Prolixibacteraceae bacterium]
MKKPVAKIVIILLVVVLLPVFVYVSDQLVSLSKNEKIVEEVFNRQLESILFSVNQHSEDIVRQWGSQLSLPVESNSELMRNIAGRLLRNNPTIREICFFRAGTRDFLAGYTLRDDSPRPFLLPSETEIEKLKNFLDNNYQKIEPVIHETELVLYFITFHSGEYFLIQITADPLLFAQQQLRPHIQQVAREMFYFQIIRQATDSVVFSTGETPSGLGTLQETELWYLPGYKLGIRLITKTLNEMVAERHRRQNIVLWSILIVVIAGTFFLFRSIRNEIRLAEMKSEFVSNVSHEIRTPLASISMYAETLLMERVKTAERRNEYLKTIYTETQRLSEMVNRILNFSRMEKNKREYVFEPVDINHIIQEVLKSFEARFQKNHITCSFLPEAQLPPILADRNALAEVMVNLIDNAVKYGKNKDAGIIVKTLRMKNQVQVEVEDNGIGISVKDKKHIFDKFYRVTKGDLALHTQGSGLGLNIVSQILKAHKVGIFVRSKPGEGSCFYLKFKLHKETHHGQDSYH